MRRPLRFAFLGIMYHGAVSFLDYTKLPLVLRLCSDTMALLATSMFLQHEFLPSADNRAGVYELGLSTS